MDAMCDDMPLVFVVDDDPDVRESLEVLVASAGWRAETYASAAEFLERPRAPVPSCLVLDLFLPDINGLDLQARVAADRNGLPIIFVAEYGDVPTVVRAMKAGAVDFLTKPYHEAPLLDAISGAIERSRVTLAREANARSLRERYATLTPRQREEPARALRDTHTAPARGDGGSHRGTTEQAGGRAARHQRDHREGPPRQGDAQDACALARSPGRDGVAS